MTLSFFKAQRSPHVSWGHNRPEGRRKGAARMAGVPSWEARAGRFEERVMPETVLFEWSKRQKAWAPQVRWFTCRLFRDRSRELLIGRGVCSERYSSYG